VPGPPEVNDLARRQIRALVERALRDAGVLGVIPTPVDAVTRRAGILEVLDAEDLPASVAAQKPSALGRVLGAVLFRERLVFVDRNQAEPRARFTEAHEVIHQIVPWHEAAFRLDDHRRLYGPTREVLEAEANLGAAQILFQDQVFMGRALDYRVTIASPMALSDEFNASRHAAIRFYVEHHPDPVALIVAGRYQDASGRVPIWARCESPSFRQRYGRVADALRITKLPTQPSTALGEVIAEALTSSEISRRDVVLLDLAGERTGFAAEAFYNQYCVFVMVAERAATRFGRRVTVRAG
jgi:hypothetical protein